LALYNTKTEFTLDCPESTCGAEPLRYRIRKRPRITEWQGNPEDNPRVSIFMKLKRICDACKTVEKVNMLFIATTAAVTSFKILWYYEADLDAANDDDELTTWEYPPSAAFIAKITN